jgi:hypothetical protein
VIAFITVLALLVWALIGIRQAGYGVPSANLIARLGLGATDPRTIIKYWVIPADGATGVMSNVLIANTPQLLFSAIYYVYNSVVTAMTMSNEWSQLANHRKGLRVSSKPRGDQRSTYFLELPYRYSVPLLTLSGIMHWLISQALFVIDLESSVNANDRENGWSNMSCGYSPLAMILVLVLEAIMVAFVVGIGFRKLKSAMPVAGSCSLAIAAACHPLSSESAVAVDATAKLQWGVMGKGRDNTWHCGVSDRLISPPLAIRSYS